jgi:hypothetical protein
MRRLFAYIAALSMTVGSLNAAAAGPDQKVRGASLPASARKVGEDRYRLHENWENAMKFFKVAYGYDKFPRKVVVNQPGIKAVHIANPSAGGEWEGLNIYENTSGVHVYVLARKK